MNASSNVPTNKSVSTLYLRNRHLLVLTIVVLLIGGLAAVSNLPRLEDPRITSRGGTILTFMPGASAERIEAQINKKIEDTLEEINEIKTIESIAQPGVSSISVELQDYVTNDTNEEVYSKIRSRIQNISNELPVGASTPVLDDNRGVTAYTLIFGISMEDGVDPSMNLLNRVALDLKDRMLNVGNTELVRIFGGVEEEITVVPDYAELAALGLNAGTLANIIAQADSKLSAGQVRSSVNTIQIEIEGALDNLVRISNIPVVASQSGTLLTVGDLATVTKSFRNPPDQIGVKNGKRIIYIGARADENIRVDKWTERALSVYEEFENDYANGLSTQIIFEQNGYTSERLTDLVSNLVLGAIVVILIVLIIMGWKAALVVGAVLPLSGAGAFFAFNFFDQQIHQMSIFGMIIAIGLVIDSAIVMTDEIRKSIQNKGMNRIEAMRHSVHHLFAPLLASTFTTILGFMPIFLLPGNAGDFVSPIATSVILALSLSFFLAMTVIPAMAASAMPIKSPSQADASWWQVGVTKPAYFDGFKQITGYAIERPKRFMLVVTLPCIMGFLSMGTMKMEFFPAADRDMFEIHLYMPESSAISYTKSRVSEADDVLFDIEGITDVHWLVGASSPTVYYNSIPNQDNNNAYAHAIVSAIDAKTATAIMPEVQNRLNVALPEAKPVVKRFAQGPPVEAPIEYRIIGPNLTVLNDLGEQVRSIVHRHPDIVHSRASIEGGIPKLWFKADEAKAEQVGLTLTDIASQFQNNLEGFTGGSVLEGVEELPVRVRLDDIQRRDIGNGSNIQLVTSDARQWIPASAIGSWELKPEVARITRYNGQRVNNIFAYTVPSAKAVSVSSDIYTEIQNSLQVPAGYRITVAGDSEQQAQAVGGLATFAPVLFTLMAATVILTFRSVGLACIVFTVATLAVGLGMLSLKIAGYPLGFNPLIGTIGLAGVVINDTIVILAAIRGNAKAKQGDSWAIITETYGCSRHVLSTTLTTIGGFIPLLIFSGGTFWPPLTVVIAGGIGFSLFLAMFFTPLAYKVYANVKYRNTEKTAFQGMRKIAI